MRAGLELQFCIDTVARDAADDFLVATMLAFARRNDFDLPANGFGVA